MKCRPSPFLAAPLRAVFVALLPLASLLPVGGCGGTAQDSGDGDGDRAGDGDGILGGDGDRAGDGDAPTRDLNPNDLVTELTVEEVGALCDEIAARYGGYGTTVDCGDGLSATTTPDRQTCVDDSDDLPASCDATVGDALSCADSLAEDCSFAAPGCLVLFSCVE